MLTIIVWFFRKKFLRGKHYKHSIIEKTDKESWKKVSYVRTYALANSKMQISSSCACYT